MCLFPLGVPPWMSEVTVFFSRPLPPPSPIALPPEVVTSAFDQPLRPKALKSSPTPVFLSFPTASSEASPAVSLRSGPSLGLTTSHHIPCRCPVLICISSSPDCKITCSPISLSCPCPLQPALHPAPIALL